MNRPDLPLPLKPPAVRPKSSPDLVCLVGDDGAEGLPCGMASVAKAGSRVGVTGVDCVFSALRLASLAERVGLAFLGG